MNIYGKKNIREKLMTKISEEDIEGLRDTIYGWKKGIEDKINFMSERIENIENGYIQRIGHLGNALNYLSEENQKLRKTPHKCPLCEGKGKYQSLQSNPSYVLYNLCDKCDKCEGNGIIWG